MNSIVKAFPIFLLGFLCFVPFAGAADVAKIGIVDFQKVLQNSSAGKYAQAEINKKGKAMEAELEKKGADIEERKKQLAKTLSGGQQQMVAIGRGLMSNPRLMIIDEMSLGLSPLIVSELFRVLHEIRASGVTILLVEQNVWQTLHEADRAYVIETGRIVLSGNALDLIAEEEVRNAYFGT